MKQFKKLIFPFLLLSFVVFTILNWLLPEGYGGWLKCITYTSVVMNVVCVFYADVVWRFNPWERVPRFAKEYDATIKYCDRGIEKEKPATISIEQTLLKVSVEVHTNQIKSQTICSNLVVENGKDVLYYTYLTDPNAVGNDNNPPATGTCRIPIEIRGKFFSKTPKILKGKYWTTLKTKGDIILKEKGEN